MAKRTNLLERNAISSVAILRRMGPRDDISHAMTAIDALLHEPAAVGSGVVA